MHYNALLVFQNILFVADLTNSVHVKRYSMQVFFCIFMLRVTNIKEKLDGRLL